jgi:hypothetical protein
MWRDHELGAAGGVDPACAHKSPPESVIGVRCVNVSFEP